MQPIHTEKAPEIIGPYHQAIRSGNTVYLSGQIGLDPHTMLLVSEEVGPQIEQVFKNLSAICEAAGGSLAHMVKINVYLTDLSHFSLLNTIMSRFFTPPFPARATIGITSLPRGALVEADGILVLA
jgi:reactive intermediate/imine deaminase